MARREPPDRENRWAGVARLLLDTPWEETRPSDRDPWRACGYSLDTSKDNVTQPTVKAAAPRVAAPSDSPRPRCTRGTRCGKRGENTGKLSGLEATEKQLTQDRDPEPLPPGAAGTRTVAAPFTCTDLLAVVVRAEGSLSTLEASLCFSTTLGSL